MGNDPSKNMIFWFFLALFILSIVLLGWLMMPFFSILVMASVVAWAFYPVHAFITVKNTINPPFAAALTCILIFFILFIPIIFFTGVLSKEAYNLYLMGKSAVISGRIQSLLESSHVLGALEKANVVLANINMNITVDDLNTGIMNLGKFIGKLLFDQLKAITSNVLNFVINFFFMLLVVFFLLLDGKKLVRFIADLSPLPEHEDEILLFKFRDMAGAIMIGNGLSGLIQGVAGGVVFAAFGLASPYLWGLLMSLFAFLPIVGIGVVFVPASLYLFLVGRFGAGIFFIVFYAILTTSIEYLVKPKIVGSRVKMHTLIVFLSIIGGLKMFGILGIIYGPLIVTAFLTLVDIYHANYQRIVEPL